MGDNGVASKARGQQSVLAPGIFEYIKEVTTPEDALLAELRAETERLFPTQAVMNVAPYQGVWMTMLVQLMGATTAVEIGTFTGYSALCIARALPEFGTLRCFDVSDEFTSVARRFWERAGVAERVRLTIGAALEHLPAIDDGSVDFVFIDADKPNQPAYYEHAVRMLRDGGLLAIDNALWGGRVCDDSMRTSDAATRSLHETNTLAARDPRVAQVLLPVADGVLLVRKRSSAESSSSSSSSSSSLVASTLRGSMSSPSPMPSGSATPAETQRKAHALVPPPELRSSKDASAASAGASASMRLNEELPYFHGMISAQEAEQRLAGSAQGTYLARNSGRDPMKIINISYVGAGDKIQNVSIYKLGSHRYCTAADGSKQIFATFADVVAHYQHTLKRPLNVSRQGASAEDRYGDVADDDE